MRKLDGTSRVTPIDMKSLNDRINNLENIKGKMYNFTNIGHKSTNGTFEVNIGYTFTPNTRIYGAIATRSVGMNRDGSADLNHKGNSWSVTLFSDKWYSVSLYTSNGKLYVRVKTDGDVSYWEFSGVACIFEE